MRFFFICAPTKSFFFYIAALRRKNSHTKTLQFSSPVQQYVEWRILVRMQTRNTAQNKRVIIHLDQQSLPAL